MTKKFFPDDCITLDGRMDEAVWNEVPEYTGFTTMKKLGGNLVNDQTFVKILPCNNYIYFGIKCMDANMEFAKNYVSRDIYSGNSVEVFLSPANTVSQIYNFALTIDGFKQTICYLEGGGVKEIYNPQWNYALHFAEDHWSVEIEFPLTAFYHTDNEVWSDVWLVNVIRNRPTTQKHFSGATIFENSTWAKPYDHYLKPDSFLSMNDMPIRPIRDGIRLASVSLDLDEKTDTDYRGTMYISISSAVEDTFIFNSDFSEETTVTLQAGVNTVAVPCCVEELKRYEMAMEFKRTSDGKPFKFFFPVTSTFEPIRIDFTLPEYRTNFYPGQDFSKIVGKVTSRKAVTLKLEGGGMQTKVIKPDADGNFTFETPDFQKGSEAILTATTDSWEIKKTMRNLVPNGRTMSWISGGNLVVNGKPVLRRNMYATYYNGGEAFRRRYDADNLHETRFVTWKTTQPGVMIPGSQAFNASTKGETTQDRVPSDEMLRKLDAALESYKNTDYVYNHTWDEPEYNHCSLIYMKHIYDYLCEKDPYHVVENATHNPEWYINFCDWMEADPYLGAMITDKGERIYSKACNKLPGYIDAAVEMNLPNKSIGIVSTCFAYRWVDLAHDYPTFDEMIASNWVMFNHGAKTASAYAYHDMNDRPQLYEGTRYIFASLETLEAPILFGERKVLLRNENVDAALYEYGNDTFFALVNQTGETQTVTLDGISGTWYHFRHNRTFADNTFTLKPFEVVIGTRAQKDRYLPTYQQTVALIERLEAERCASRSLLFGREADIVTNPPKMYKLFDGVKDNLAKEMRGKDLFVEIDLTKVKPTFSTIVLNGWHLEGTTVKVRTGDEWTELEPAQVQSEEFGMTYILKEAISPDALRFDIPQERIELYELEVF